MMGIGILSLLTLSPLVGVIILAFIPREKAGTIKTIGILTTIFSLMLAIVVYLTFDGSTDQVQFVEHYQWITIPIAAQNVFSLDYSLGIDGLSMPLLLLGAIVGAMSAIAAANMINKRWKEYYILFLLMQVGVFGVFAAQNLFLFFIFFEVSLITMFFLIGIYGNEDREYAAFKFLLYNGLASAIMLLAFIALMVYAGYNENLNMLTTEYQTIAQNLAKPDISPVFLHWTFFALLIAFGIKLPVFPLHTWLLNVHYQAPVPMSMILSGVLLKIGAYAMFRMGFNFYPDLVEKYSLLLIILGLINILYAAIIAYVQEDFKMIVVYSSVSHMGIVLLGLGALNIFGFQGAVFQMVSHGLISATLFYLVGVIYTRVHTAKMKDLGGMAKTMPITSGVMLTAAMASLGLPLMSGFVSEFFTFIGLFKEHAILAAIGSLGILFTSAYLLRGTLNVTFGPTSELLAEQKDARFLEMVPMVVFLGLIILIGVIPSILSEPLQATLQSLLARIGG